LENILIDSTGHIKISDFGLSTWFQGTKSYTICGTRQYMAPEVIEEVGYDYGVDLWALGIMIYEMLLGHTPFYNENHKTLFQNIVHERVHFNENEHIDAASKSLITKLLDKKPSHRLGYNDIENLKSHVWFEGINWEGHMKGEHVLPPYMPHFEPEVDEELKTNGLPTIEAPESYNKLFNDF